MDTFKVGERTIGGSYPTFVIAEIGINHNGDVNIAEKLVEESFRCGADAVKFQTYVTEKRVPRHSPIYHILKKCELSHETQARLKSIAERRRLIFFSTPFDFDSVDFLKRLGVGLFKIASFDLVNLELLRKVASAKSPVIASRGMANRSEIDSAIRIFEDHSIPYALLHCISAYPTPKDQANLNVIRALARAYDCPVGYSDHTLGIEVPIYAAAVGAKIIEKHLTLDKKLEGPDHALSAEPAEFAEMVTRIRELEKILGESEFRVYEAEKATMIHRRPSN